MNNTITRKSIAKSIAPLAIAAMVLPTGCRGSPRSSSLTQDQDYAYKTGFQVGSNINGCVDALRQHGAK